MKIIITGASRGIGFFLMQKMISDGHEVFGTYNSTEPKSDLIKYFTKLDISDSSAVNEWVKSILKPDDEIVLLNCAGINYNAFAHKADIDKWQKVVSVNLFGTFNLIHSVLPFMREKDFGRIINFSSIVAQKAIAGTSAYAASKSALWGMSKSIAAENAKKGITINNLNLGYFNIGMINEVPEEILSSIKKTIPMQELGNPENIYNAVKNFILCDYLTGTSLDINGGLF